MISAVGGNGAHVHGVWFGHTGPERSLEPDPKLLDRVVETTHLSIDLLN